MVAEGEVFFRNGGSRQEKIEHGRRASCAQRVEHRYGWELDRWVVRFKSNKNKTRLSYIHLRNTVDRISRERKKIMR